MNQNIIIGVISGILTTVIIYFIVTFFKKVFLPWYLGLTYRGIDVNGKWSTTNRYHCT